jgi:hypothetical protein
MVPRAARIALLVNPQAPGADSLTAGSYGEGRLFPTERGTPQGGVAFEEAQTAARTLSQEVVVVKASSETDLDAAFAILSHVGA